MLAIDEFTALAQAPAPVWAAPAAEPDWLGAAWGRKLTTVPAPAWSHEALSLTAAREAIDAGLEAYFADPAPAHMLLVQAAAGVGKTFRAIHLAEKLASQGRRVLYAGPRHAFFQDILALTERPEQWYEWLPRQAGGEHAVETCLWARECNAWIQKGYPGMAFCSGVCGWTYVNAGCAYHAQKNRPEPVIFGQHAHILAHPLQFHAVIGDESPLGAFMHEWVLDVDDIVPLGMDPLQDLTHILHALVSLAVSTTASKTALTGPALLTALGGAARVLAALAEFQFEVGAQALAPEIHRAEDAQWAKPFHLPALVRLLRAEATAAEAGQVPYLERVILAKGKMLLLLRRAVSEQLPQHVVWLDATGEPRIYEALFRRPVQVLAAQPRLKGRVIQVWNRTNGKGQLVVKGAAQAGAVRQLEAQITGITAPYQDPAVITYQGLVTDGKIAGVKALHFYAARGTNALQNVDCLVVAGTPMPAVDVLAKVARMVFAERMQAFNTTWTSRLEAYNYTDADGQGRAYPVGGYWSDPDLAAVLWSMREAELIQAVHRARPISRAVDVYLLSNVPLPAFHLRPGDLRSIQEVLGAPPGVDAFQWGTIKAIAAAIAIEQGYVTADDLLLYFKLGSRTTALHYLDLLEAEGWTRAVLPGRSGRPPRALKPGEVSDHADV